jgi:hypothetical protein
MASGKELTVDQMLDELDAQRRGRLKKEAQYRGKGFTEDIPEAMGVTTQSWFARRKLGDYEDGYFSR